LNSKRRRALHETKGEKKKKKKKGKKKGKKERKIERDKGLWMELE